VGDDRPQVAVDVVARHLLARAAADVAAEDWDLVPEVGEHDWTAIGKRLQQLAPFPPATEFEAAYEYLEGRADDRA
jgi:hypothetical protein